MVVGCYLLSGAVHLSPLPLILEQAFIFSLKALATAPASPQLHLLPPHQLDVVLPQGWLPTPDIQLQVESNQDHDGVWKYISSS